MKLKVKVVLVRWIYGWDVGRHVMLGRSHFSPAALHIRALGAGRIFLARYLALFALIFSKRSKSRFI